MLQPQTIAQNFENNKFRWHKYDIPVITLVIFNVMIVKQQIFLELRIVNIIPSACMSLSSNIPLHDNKF